MNLGGLFFILWGSVILGTIGLILWYITMGRKLRGK